jgi:NAD-dependent SIR2 family protein deacetylase
MMGDEKIDVAEETMRAAPPHPRCPSCGQIARPNILMFSDMGWISDRTDMQGDRYQRWLSSLGSARIAIVECGAGSAIPTVRFESERLSRRSGATLIRINLREPEAPQGQIGLPMSGLETLSAMQAILG